MFILHDVVMLAYHSADQVYVLNQFWNILYSNGVRVLSIIIILKLRFVMRNFVFVLINAL